MTATPAQVEAAHAELWEFRCREIEQNGRLGATIVCRNHWWAPWTERGCPVAVGIADTIADAT